MNIYVIYYISYPNNGFSTFQISMMIVKYLFIAWIFGFLGRAEADHSPFIFEQDKDDTEFQDILEFVDNINHQAYQTKNDSMLPTPQYNWGGLYPYETPTREQKSLDGVWNFRLSPKDDPNKGFRESWFSAPLSKSGPIIAMPVPSSYNDITQEKDIREHIGWAW